MTKEIEPMTVLVPAYDTPRGDLSPLVNEAMAGGATSRGYDADTIEITFTDADQHKAFASAIDAIVNPKRSKK